MFFFCIFLVLFCFVLFFEDFPAKDVRISSETSNELIYLKCTLPFAKLLQNLPQGVYVFQTECSIHYLPVRQLGLSLYLSDIQTRTAAAFSTASAIACRVEPYIQSTSTHTRKPAFYEEYKYEILINFPFIFVDHCNCVYHHMY